MANNEVPRSFETREVWEGYSCPIPLGSLGERCDHPRQSPGATRMSFHSAEFVIAR